MPANGRDEGRPFSNNPAASFTRRMRRTASSSRAMLISPDFTCAVVAASSGFQLSGAMKMSSPALNDAAQLATEQPGTWP